MTYRIFFISLIIIIFLSLLGLIETINDGIYDNYIVTNKKNTSNNNIIIIEIDPKSIKEIGYWPWKRKYYTEIIKKILKGKPKVLGINLSFTQSQGQPKDDAELYKELLSYPNIVLTSKFKNIKMHPRPMLFPETNLFPEIKHAHPLVSEKDIVRSFPPFKIDPAFSIMVLKMYYENNDTHREVPQKLKTLFNEVNKIHYSLYDSILIDFRRTPDQFKHYSFIDVLKNKVNVKDFNNKIVLIGLTDKYLSPFYATPYTIRKEYYSVSLVDLQAQIIDSLIDYRDLKTQPLWVVYLISIIIAFIFLLFIKNKSTWIQGIYLIIFVFGSIIIDYCLFLYTATWFPPAILLSLLIVIFGFSTYFAINRVDNELIEAINRFKEDENLPLKKIPSNITHKLDVLKSFMNIIAQDRQTIKAIINGVKNGILVIDSSGTIQWANGQILELIKNTLVLEKRIQDIIPAIDINDINSMINERNIFKKEIQLAGLDFLLVVNPIDIGSRLYVAILNDITELKAIDRLKTDMVRMVSHELKTPLMRIMLATENIEDIEARNKVLENNTVIAQSTEYMVNTINNFLNLNKLESALMDVKLVKANLIKLVNQCIDLQSGVAHNKNVQLVFEYEDIPEVDMDSKWIEIVVNNLISNAIKYSQSDNKVVIKMFRDKNHIKTSVIDFGIGIAQEEVDKIFNKFYRASNNEANNIQGTGLGLSIVSKIIDLHNGSLSVKSELNKGSEFTFTIPIESQNDQQNSLI